MPNFTESFIRSKGLAIEYKGLNLVMGDYLSFTDGDHLLITFEKTNSEWRQGIGLRVFGFFEINGNPFPDRVILWEDTSPKTQIITIHQDQTKRKQPKRLPQKGLLGIKNIWDPGTGSVESWYGGAAMIVEEIESGRRYRCNDGHPDENFDDIVFTVQRVPK